MGYLQGSRLSGALLALILSRDRASLFGPNGVLLGYSGIIARNLSVVIGGILLGNASGYRADGRDASAECSDNRCGCCDECDGRLPLGRY